MSSDPEPGLHALVLAAGSASRFGSPKQLVRIGGQPMLHRAVSQATEVVGHAVTVVLGAYADQLAPLLKHTSASVLINRHWEEGIASSLRAGIANLPGSCDGVLIVLADQVSVTTFDLKRLATAWKRQPEWLIAATYDGHVGVPAIFPRTTFSAFSDLRGDTGARAILSRHVDRCLRVPMPNAAIDIDRPEDLLNIAAASAEGNNPATPPTTPKV
jgi:CTP:molybdopterin cytidylyltransferase MocA